MYINTFQGGSFTASTLVSNIKAAADAGYNYILLAFLVSKNADFTPTASQKLLPQGAAYAWTTTTDAQKTDVLSYLSSRNAKIMVSVGGAFDYPYDSPFYSKNGAAYGTDVANWASQQRLNGVDFDLEEIQSTGGTFVYTGYTHNEIVKFFIDATFAARNVLPSGIVSHAPQAVYFAPYFGKGWFDIWNGISSAGLTGIKSVTDFIAVQYYNIYQSQPCFVGYEALFTHSEQPSPCNYVGISINEMAQQGVELNKIVLGKYLTDGHDGYVSPSDLHNFVSTARTNLGWNGGVMFWRWEPAAQTAVATIYP